MTSPARGFPADEYRDRLARAQALMAEADLGALFLTTEPDIRYFTGFLTRFWESPTRPWFLIVPASGEPVAVIPSIGAHLMGQTWIADIRTWRSPDYADDGVSPVATALAERVPKDGRIGVPSGAESHIRMPLESWVRLQALLGADRLVGDSGIMRRLRLVKSDREIGKIKAACAIADRAFQRAPEIAAAGTPLDRVFREFQVLCLQEGADWVAYLAGGAGPGGYGDVISPATDAPLQPGDVLMLDTGLVWDGYFCDFDRNYAVPPVAQAIEDAHARLLDASDAAFEIARPGATAAELFQAMDRIVSGGAGGSQAGRLGHGLGMQLTESPSLIPDDRTVLEAGMVLTLEPGITLGPGRTLVHEENIAITPTGATYLSTPAPRHMPRLEGAS